MKTATHAITRRCLLAATGAGAAAITMPRGRATAQAADTEKRHIVTLAFDDGFRKSFTKTAEIYEEFGLSACLNVIAAPGGEEDPFIEGVGDFALWNDLQERGHEIMPHGLRHARLARMPAAEATGMIERCFEIFERDLKRFDTKNCIFHFPYNASTPELEAWLSERVRAFRTGGKAINPWPRAGMKRLTCVSHGPDNCEQHVDEMVERLLDTERGWLIYNTHGLDGEGWGPMRATYLQRLLKRLLKVESVDILPTAGALKKYAGADTVEEAESV